MVIMRELIMIYKVYLLQYWLKMNTRSRARADQEIRRIIEKQKRIERRQRIESRGSLGTPYNLRTRMGRRGVNTSKGTGRGSKGENFFDVSEVAPVVLFPVTEEVSEIEKGGSEVKFIMNHNEKFLCAIIMLTSITESGNSCIPLNLVVVWAMVLVHICCVFMFGVGF